jgi:chromatin remodeling complex protein RSC6
MASKQGKGTKGGAKRPISAFMKLMKPSPELAEIVGHEPLPRTEVTKRVWDYIRQHNLQDPHDKRTIRADHRLKAIIHQDSINMFKLTRCINGHLAGGQGTGPDDD